MLIIRDDVQRDALPLYQVEEITLEQAMSFISADRLPANTRRSDNQPSEASPLPYGALTA